MYRRNDPMREITCEMFIEELLCTKAMKRQTSALIINCVGLMDVIILGGEMGKIIEIRASRCRHRIKNCVSLQHMNKVKEQMINR